MKSRGMTMMEVLIVILIISVVMAVVVVNVGGIFRSRMVTSSGKLTAMSRYAYEQATLQGEIVRLSLDLDSGDYGLEKVKLAEQCGDLGEGFRGEKGGSASRSGKGDRSESDPPEGLSGEALEDRLVRNSRLPKGVRFSKAIVGRQTKPVTEGKAYVHFLPNGTAERAMVWLTDDDTTFTLEIRSLTGGGRIHRKDLEEREFRK
jgi:prepilin-type N-terminal cleavage/methylation domain-containing protein